MMDQPIAQTLTRERLARLARDEAHIFGEDRSPHYRRARPGRRVLPSAVAPIVSIRLLHR
jgi:hypothetical protein